MNANGTGFESSVDRGRAIKQLDNNICEAAAQLLGHDLVNDHPFTRFVLLCTARAQFENEGVVGMDPELQWVQVAKDAFVTAADDKNEGYFPLSYLLSDSDPAIESQRELYQEMATGLVITNTDASPDTYWGIDFAVQVSNGEVQIRYT